ncbi:PEP-CTERM sorting domain-containing protein [Duganella aceris]|uniref:PEP-CTERM sorting domain-containing protein n=1 Tax=Duganella aceris TaxID=2703883 RepID=UPI001A955ACF|nr:PEP-CTERM sorting domain-containing protein [Duganella aceris]
MKTTYLHMLFLGCCAAWSAASATTVQLDFSVERFAPSNGNPAPSDPVQGRFWWESDSLTGPITRLLGVDLRIGEHRYGLSELATSVMSSGIPGDPGSTFIGGKYGTEYGVTTETNDFTMAWDNDTRRPFIFYYAVDNRSGIWGSDSALRPNYTRFEFTLSDVPPPVPEPAAWALLLAGVPLLAMAGRRARRRAAVFPLNGEEMPMKICKD